VYLVELHHQAGPRSDEVTSARSGFKSVLRRRLGSIEVRLLAGSPSGLVRRYVLSYKTGDMGKSLLDKLAVQGADEKIFYSHAFEYEQKAPDQDGVTLFGSPIPWVMGTTDWGLSGSKDSSFGFHGFVGLGVTRKKRTATVGIGFGFGRRNGETLVSMLDLNGDGLPDRVYGGGPVLFNAGEGQALSPLPPQWDPGASLASGAYGIDGRRLGKDTGNSFDVSLQAFYGSGKLGGSLNIGAAYAVSSSKDFVLDANGDGLPDFVNDGKVYFNQPRSASCPAGASRDQCCPAGGFCFLPSMAVAALQDLGDSTELLDGDATMAQANQEMQDALTPEDAVLEWTAPYAGAVDVAGQIAFLNPTASGERRDGVRLRVYRYDPFSSSPAEEEGTYLKTPGDATVTPVQLGNVSVTPGTILYFVLSTLSDFPMNDAEGKISPAELVSFAPVITYRGAAAADRTLPGPSGAPLYRFDAAKDFVLAGDPQGVVNVPRNGRLAVDLDLHKRPTSDDVRICVQYQDPPDNDGTPPPRPGPCSAGAAVNAFYKEYGAGASLDERLSTGELQVKAGGTLYFRVDTHVAIDMTGEPRAVTFKASGTYSCAEDDTNACVPPDPNDTDEQNALSFKAIPYMPLHSELVDLASTAWKPSGTGVRPYRVTRPGTITIGSFARYATRDVPIYFTVRTLNKLLLKVAGDHGSVEPESGSLQPIGASAHLDAGDLVFFEGHSESARSFDPIDLGEAGWSGPAWNLTCSFLRDGGGWENCGGLEQFTSDGHANEWDRGNQPILAGGFHGWRYGAWNGKDGETFAPWVYRGPTKADVASWNREGDDLVDSQSEQMQKPDDPQRTRLRLAGFLVPNTTGTVLTSGGTGFEGEGDAFVSPDGNTYFASGRMHAGRKGESASIREKASESAEVKPLEFRIGKIGRSSTSLSLSGSASVEAGLPDVFNASLGVSLSTGLSQQKMDVLDMNGDGILDVVVGAGMPGPLSSTRAIVDRDTTSHVRVTNPVQLSTRRTVRMNGFPQISRDIGGAVNLGTSGPQVHLTPRGATRAVVARFPGLGGGLAFSVGSVLEQLVDVNGDGLPDSVRVSTTGCPSGIAVHLNMGTSFAAGEDCVNLDPSAFPVDSVLKKVGVGGGPALRRSNTVTLQGTSGAGISRLGGGTDRAESYGASISAETSLTATNVAFIDVTGDGLPDYVYKGNAGDEFRVRVNTGYGFAPEHTWHAAGSWPNGDNGRRPRHHLGRVVESILDVFGANDGIVPLEATGSHSVRPSYAFAFNVSFPLFIVPWVHIGAGASYSPKKVSGFELGLQDIDGDGLPDHVLKTSDNAPVWARLNQLGRSNLLKRVLRPLGGSIELAYMQRVGNTVEMPQSRWVLTNVIAHDGRAGGPGHDLETRWAYGNGRQDRIEREFLGFDKVTRTNPDETSVEQQFRNDGVLTKGLLVSERMLGSDKRPLVETVNTWSDPIKQTTAVEACTSATPILVNRESYCSSFFTKLDAVEKRFYEGEAKAGIVTRQELGYDGKGDVVFFRDLGDVADARDDIQAVIQYASDAAASALHSVSRPKLVEIRDLAGTLLRSRSAEYDENGNLKHFEAPLGDGRIAETDLRWNSNGTLDWVKGPENETRQRYETHYGYDPVTASYIAAITDSHGYASSAEFDLRFGEATKTTDVNGKVTTRKLDAFGRLWRLAGPKDTLDAPTVWIDYSHLATVPYAWTHNRLPRKTGDTRGTVDTVIAMDGLGRVIQTKKTAEIATSETTKGLGWSVTGHQVFDLMGRVVLQGQTFASFSSRPEYVAGTPKNPTRLSYDELGRMIETVEPNGSLTRVQYGFGTPAGSLVRRFKTTTTDAEGKSKAAYKDAGDRVVAVEERIDGRAPATQYEYSPVGELTAVLDAAGNATRLAYDLLGRRTKLVNPDTGELRFELDPAGNLVRKYDPNLDAARSSIHYVYDFDQLVRIEYPDATRNVTYTYGSAAASAQNGAGRVVEVKDDAGRELRSYGELGELTSTTRILRPILPGDRERSFTTSFAFDSFGRMMSITYPDGETVEYAYDAGGLLERATGHRAPGTAVPGDEVYLASMMYDEFGQRVRMLLGNGVVSAYRYEPLTRRLASLTTTTPLGRTLQAITYAYDRVGNVKTMVNGLGEPVGDQSGTVSFQYGYDDLYRLTSASGQAKSRAHTIDRYTASYAYSDIHNMTSNVQIHEMVHGGQTLSVERPPKTNHDFAYTYDPAAPHRARKIGDTFLVYDGNGNTVRECRDQAGDPTCGALTDHRRSYAWSAENRLDHVIDGGGRNITRFLYDAGGDRVVKLGRGGEGITIGQFWSLKGRRAATKHVFAGATRLASKLLPPPGWEQTSPTVVVSAIAMTAASDTTSTTTSGGILNDNGCDPSNYQPTKCPVLPGGEPSINHQYDDTRVRPETYYYHQDHLGSTSWVTDQHARVHEHVEYFPYGEVWRDPRSDADGGPVKGQRFLFTSKEMDEETGLYYFGARYFHPAQARWLSADPILDQYLEGERGGSGVYTVQNLSLFAYAHQNPIKFIDPSGNDVIVYFAGFHGFWEGPYRVLEPNKLTTGKMATEIKKFAEENKIPDVAVMAYATGKDMDHNVRDVVKLIKDNLDKPGEKVVVYGYSLGGEAATRVATELQKKGIDVDLLVTADSYVPDNWAKHGAGSSKNIATSTVPPNVKRALNYFQRVTKNQHGKPFQITEGAKTLLDNKELKVEHPDVDEKTRDEVQKAVKDLINRPRE
jgi:RHS repeat-associated protein